MLVGGLVTSAEPTGERDDEGVPGGSRVADHERAAACGERDLLQRGVVVLGLDPVTG